MGKFAERYATNKVAEEEGQWVSFGDDIEVKLRRLNSDFSREVRRKLEKPYEGQYRTRPMPDSLNEELMIKQLADAIIIDWKGVEDPTDDTKMLTCTRDNVIRIMTQFKDFRDDIVQASMLAATFQSEIRKEAEGNSTSA